MAALGLLRCLWALSCCREWGLLSSHGYQTSHCSGFSCWITQALECGLSSCDTWAQLPYSTWNLPEPGMEPTCSALARGFLTSGPPGKSYFELFTGKSLISISLRFVSGVLSYSFVRNMLLSFFIIFDYLCWFLWIR